MKHFLTKVFSVVLCGALLFTSCHKEIKQDIDTLKADTSELWAQFKSLKSSMETTYATKVELQAVESTVNTVKTSVTNLETLVATKADKTALEAAVKEVKDAMKNFITADALKDYVKTSALNEQLTKLTTDLQTYASTEITRLEGLIKAIETCDCDLTEIETAISTLKTAFESAETEIDAAMEELEGALEELEAAIDEINSDEFLADLYDYVDEGDDELLEKIELANEAIAKAAADAKLALQMAGSAGGGSSCDCPDWTVTIEEIVGSIGGLQKQLEDLESGCSCTLDEEAVEAIIADYLDIVDGVNDSIEAINFKLSEREIVSIKLVPSVLVNGSPAAKFTTLTYGDVELSTATTLTYLVNPSTADLTDTEFAIVSSEAEIITKASSSLSIQKGEGDEEGEIYLTLERDDIDGNVFALVATTNGASVYSDFAQVYEVEASGEDLEWVNPGKVSITTEETFNVAENVYVEAFDAELFGLEYVYELEGEEFDGIIENLEETMYKVTVSLVDADDVVISSTELIVIVCDGITAEVIGTAYRLSFSLEDAKTWLTDLKALPNTTETIKNAAVLLAKGDYKAAMELLGGVPFFKKEYITITGTGSADYAMLAAPMMQRVSLPDGFEFPEGFEGFEDILNSIPDETIEKIKDMVKESEISIDELIEKVESIEGIEDVLEILGDEEYKEIIDEALDILDQEGIEIEDIIPEDVIKDAIIESLPEELDVILEYAAKIKTKLEGYLQYLEDEGLEAFLKKAIQKVVSVLEQYDVEGLVAELLERVGIEDLPSISDKLPLIKEELAKVKAELKAVIEKIEDALAGLENLPEIELPELPEIELPELPEIDFDAIIEKIESIEISDIITPEMVEAIKAELKPMLKKILAYLENFCPDVDDDDDDDTDDPQDPIVPPTDEEDYFEGMEELQRLAIEAAINDFYSQLNAENLKIANALENGQGSWAQLLDLLGNDFMQILIKKYPEFGAALDALLENIVEIAYYRFDGEFDSVKVDSIAAIPVE